MGGVGVDGHDDEAQKQFHDQYHSTMSPPPPPPPPTTTIGQPSWKDAVLADSLRDDLDSSQHLVSDLQEQVTYERARRLDAEKMAADLALRLSESQARVMRLEHEWTEQSSTTRVQQINHECEERIAHIETQCEKRILAVRTEWETKWQNTRIIQQEHREVLEELRRRASNAISDTLGLAGKLESKVRELLRTIDQLEEDRVALKLRYEKQNVKVKMLETQLENKERDRIRDEKLILALTGTATR